MRRRTHCTVTVRSSAARMRKMAASMTGKGPEPVRRLVGDQRSRPWAWGNRQGPCRRLGRPGWWWPRRRGGGQPRLGRLVQQHQAAFLALLPHTGTGRGRVVPSPSSSSRHNQPSNKPGALHSAAPRARRVGRRARSDAYGVGSAAPPLRRGSAGVSSWSAWPSMYAATSALNAATTVRLAPSRDDLIRHGTLEPPPGHSLVSVGYRQHRRYSPDPRSSASLA
jgi:hypothetical protein